MRTPLTSTGLSFASVPVPRTNRTPSRLLGQLGAVMGILVLGVMRGLAALLDAAAHGDMAEPEQIVEYASGQIERLSDLLAAAIRDCPQS